MAGDANDAHLWQDADVWVAFDLDTAKPATIDDAFEDTPGWELVGLLDGDQGFVESREEDVDDKFAWGGILMRTARNHFKLTRTFTAYEHNDTTKRLRWPGSSTGTIKVPKPERIQVAFETRDTTLDVVHRVGSYFESEVTINGDVTENETDMASLPFLATFFPDGDGNVLWEQETESGS